MSKRKRLDLGDSPAVELAKKLREQEANQTQNPYTGAPYTEKYYEILKKRKELPVFEQKEEFLNNLRTHQVLVLQGETGSGKTTQVLQSSSFTSHFRFHSFVWSQDIVNLGSWSVVHNLDELLQ